MAELVADYFTLTNTNQIAYLGADGPRRRALVTGEARRSNAGRGVSVGVEINRQRLGVRLERHGLGGRQAEVEVALVGPLRQVGGPVGEGAVELEVLGGLCCGLGAGGEEGEGRKGERGEDDARGSQHG